MRKTDYAHLTSTKRIRIEIKRRTTREKKEHVRLSVLIMLDGGFTNEMIALCQGIDAGTISNWKRKYESVSRDLNRYLANYSEAGVTVILHCLGFFYKKVKPVPGKADEITQQAFVAELEPLLQTPDTVVYFTDATHPTHNTQPVMAGSRKAR
jgi:transposase